MLSLCAAAKYILYCGSSQSVCPSVCHATQLCTLMDRFRREELDTPSLRYVIPRIDFDPEIQTCYLKRPSATFESADAIMTTLAVQHCVCRLHWF